MTIARCVRGMLHLAPKKSEFLVGVQRQVRHALSSFFFFASITFFYFIQEASTSISAEWIIAVHMAAVYEF